MTKLRNTLLILAAIFMTSCATVMPDQVGVKRTFGRIQDNVRPPGLVSFNPFTTMLVRVPIRTMNLAITENLPSKEGLTIRSESSILYRVQPSSVPQILKETGMAFEEMLILPVFRSAASDVCSKYDEELIKELLEKGADAYCKCDGVDDVITNLAYCEEKAVALTDLFLKYGGRINSADEDNASFLAYAISNDNLELVDYLLARGASKTQRDTNRNMGCLPIHGCESLSMLKKLEEGGFDLNATCDNGRNLLHFVARENLIEMAQYLIDKRLVKLNQKDKAGETPLDYANRFNNSEVAQLIQRAMQ